MEFGDDLKPGMLSGYLPLDESLYKPSKSDPIGPSALDKESFDYFAQREAELMAKNANLDQRTADVLKMVDNAVKSKPSVDRRDEDMSRLNEEFSKKYSRPSSRAAAERSEAPAAAPKPTPTTGPVSNSAMVSELQGTIRVQKERIIELNRDLQKAQTDIQKRDQQIQDRDLELRQKDDAIRKLEKQLKELQILQERQSKRTTEEASRAEGSKAQLDEMKAELERAAALAKRQEKEVASKDAKLTKLLDEVERWKAQCAELRVAQRAGGAAQGAREDVEKAVAEAKRLERQRNELLAAFKKQLKLIDVLKRQKAHMEAARALNFTEEEFIRVLELGDKMQL